MSKNMTRDPFARAKAMVAAIAGILGTYRGIEAQMRIRGLGSYRSRGKGRGDGIFRLAGMANMRSKYDPHQGPRERARRIKQGLAQP